MLTKRLSLLGYLLDSLEHGGLPPLRVLLFLLLLFTLLARREVLILLYKKITELGTTFILHEFLTPYRY